jgi:hypothetical protein
MAKRRARRARSGFSIDGLMAQLSNLDTQRRAIVAQIQHAVSSLVGGGSEAPRRRGRPAGSKNTATTAAPKKRRKMSAKARKAISDAQKKRWAKQKAAAK